MLLQVFLLSLATVWSADPPAKRARVDEDTRAAARLLLDLAATAAREPERPQRELERRIPDHLENMITLSTIALVRRDENHVERSIKGHPDIRFVVYLDGPADHTTHQGLVEAEMANRAAGFGLAAPFVARSLPEVVTRGEWEIHGFPKRCRKTIKRMSESNFTFLRTVKVRPGDEWPVSLSESRKGLPPFSYPDALSFGIALVQALKKLHLEANMVHGLLNPVSVLTTSGGSIMFSDFRRTELNIAGAVLHLSRRPVGATRDNILFFAPSLWPQRMGEPFGPVTPRSDLYSALEIVNWLAWPHLYQPGGAPSVSFLKQDMKLARAYMARLRGFVAPEKILSGLVPDQMILSPAHYDALVYALGAIRASVR